MTLDAQGLLKALTENGNSPVNNAWIAGRMPPGSRAPMYPTGFDVIFRDNPDNTPIARLGRELPPALAAPKPAFQQAADPNLNSIADPGLNPRFLV